MARARTHKDMEFEVANEHLKTFNEAAGRAIAISAAFGKPVVLNVLIYSVAGARFYGGIEAVKAYKEDPDASVFDRVVVRANSQGRIR